MTNKTIQHLLRRITALLRNRILNSASSFWNKFWSFILGHIKRRPLRRPGSGQTLPHRKNGGTKTVPLGESCWVAPSTLPFGLNFTRQTHEAYLGSNYLNFDSQPTEFPTLAGVWADEPEESDTTLTEDIADNDSIQYAHSQSIDHAPEMITNLSLTSKSEIAAVIYPTMPSKLPRYKREWVYDPDKSPRHKLKPLQHDFSDGELPAGWEQFIHPEGGPFFWNREQRIVTDAWLYDREIFRVLIEFITQIDEFVRSRNLEKNDDVDLVLEVVNAIDGSWWCGYYFVHHSSRLLFWLESYIVDDFLEEVKGDLSPSHVELQLQCQYWRHWSLFPNVIRSTSEVMNLLTDVIRDAQTDLLTSEESTINLTPEKLRGMMGIVNDAKAAMNQGQNCSTWFVGRFMSLFWEDRFRNFYGQRGARLSRKQSIHGRPPSSKPTSYLFKILSPILFCAPDVHLKTMEELWVDKLTVLHCWTELFNKLNQEWMGHTVYASILLNANVAFLAIPSNDPTVTLQGSPVEIASFLSIVTSVASIMLGLLLCRQHQTRERATVDEVYSFLSKRNHPTRGLETLSIMYSLPYALLMWGMVTFLLAFSIMCFQNTNAPARYIVGVAWVLNAVLVAWCIRMSWEETENRWWSLYKGIWKKFVEGAHSLFPARCQASDSHESVSGDEGASVVESTPSAIKVKPTWFRRLKPQSSQPAV